MQPDACHVPGKGIDVIGDLLSSVIIGWRSALCLGCGLAIVGLISWLNYPRGLPGWAFGLCLVGLYVVGGGWEFLARRRRRAPPNNRLRGP